MAYVCDVDQVGSAPRLTETRPTLATRLAEVPRSAFHWLVAWNEAADEAAAARATFGNSGGKITDNMEREMMGRLLRWE